MSNDFLPTGYEAPKGNNGYFKPQLKKSKVRILSSPIVGYVDWDKSGEKPKPVRTKTQTPKIGKDEPKHFWALKVRNYETKMVQIRDITQASIRNTILAFMEGERGDPREFDLQVWKTGESLETEYFVQTTPDGKKELSKEVQEAVDKTYCNLEALFDNRDPFEKVKLSDNGNTDEDMPRGDEPAGVTDTL